MSDKQPPDESLWPSDVHGITWDDTGRLGVGSDNRLYWDGKPVVTESRLGFTTLQKFGAGVTVIAAALGGIYALLKIIDWFNKLGVTQ